MKLDRVRALALALPAATEEPHHEATSFRVGGKIFATIPPEQDRVHIFVQGEDLELALESESDFVEPLPWGKKTVGVRVRFAKAGVRFVDDLLRRAWLARAPKSLAGELRPRGS